MTYATLLVNLQLGQKNSDVLQITADLADRFHARVVGIAAGQAIPVACDEGYRSGKIFDEDLQRLDEEIGLAELEFRNTFRSRNTPIEWRSQKMFPPLSDYIVDQARSADLIVMGVGTASMLRSAGCEDAGVVALTSGRPILVVPSTADLLVLQKIVVCWKDTRESRRAIHDALPMLLQATHVEVVEVVAARDLAESQARLDDVVAWLKAHGVRADWHASASTGDDRANLEDILRDRRPDLVVAGAYGHSRFREWVLGGTTRDMLFHAERCALLAH